MRAAQGSDGQISYKMETTPYTKEAVADVPFGFVDEDIELPNGENPYEPQLAAGSGRRGPFTHTRRKREYEFPVPYKVADYSAPIENALGLRTVSDILDGSLVKVGEAHTFTEANNLPTMTVMQGHAELDFLAWWSGCKSNLSVSITEGEEIKHVQDVTAAILDVDDSPASIPPVTLPDVEPMHFCDLEEFTVGSKTIETLMGADFNWDNGNTARHHGNCRDAYAIVEGTARDKYDHKFTIDPIDMDLMNEAYENTPVQDITMQFARGKSGDGTVNDGIQYKFFDSKITKAPIPHKAEGTIESEIGFLPLNTEITIYEPI